MSGEAAIGWIREVALGAPSRGPSPRFWPADLGGTPVK
jgi:hypothetical protein